MMEHNWIPFDPNFSWPKVCSNCDLYKDSFGRAWHSPSISQSTEYLSNDATTISCDEYSVMRSLAQ